MRQLILVFLTIGNFACGDGAGRGGAAASSQIAPADQNTALTCSYIPIVIGGTKTFKRYCR